ncbi:sensor domain-containing diguanylate cyclase [Thermomonas sp. S9]|uniref:sensor domain-containing diguanylate cyclase n=1 Tax=Thermomonas sp. S9 TaxID=2885203 RepID=UPI00216B594F|nr:sensor domain-containing diguanylate cyclase [Thermomonas sp. S9]MCR6495489.1 sensor domain-containing diguanylate cyclase [Thermomonas sp. S9]
MQSGEDASGTWSMRHRLAFGLALATLLPVLLFGAVLLWGQWRDSRDTLLLRLDANARLNAGVIDDYIDAQQAGLDLLADQMAMDLSRAKPDLAKLLYIYPGMLRALHVDADGNVTLARDARGRELVSPAGGVGGEDWFRWVRAQSRIHVSGVRRQDAYGNEAVVMITAPVLRGNTFDGALQAAIPVESFTRLPSESLARRDLQLLLLDADNRVIHAAPGLSFSVLDDAGPLGRQLRALARPTDREVRVRRMSGLLHDGDDAYVAAVQLKHGWTLVLAAPGAVLRAPLLPRLLLLAAMLGVTLLGVGAAIWWQRKMLSDSLGYLLASLRGYALGGRIDTSVNARLPDELLPLAEGIGELGARMNAAFDELNKVLEEREHVIATRTDSLRQAVAELDRLSRTDALTGSLNYRGFLEAGDRLWGEAQASGKPLSVLALDIDHFKRYNDLYGHSEGDSALRRFAGAVRSALLHSDDVLARPGGEEFTVLLPATTHAQAMHVAKRVCQRVRDADIAHAGSPKGRITVSVGVATLQPGDTEVEDILKRADAALYRAKAAGRDTISD